MKNNKRDGRIVYQGPYVYGGVAYLNKAAMEKVQRRQLQREKWEAKQPKANYTAFQKWLITFSEEKGLDLSEPVKAGDGSMLQAGDVLSAMMNAPAEEQAQIKDAFVKIDFKNGDVMRFIRHCAQALSAKDKVSM